VATGASAEIARISPSDFNLGGEDFINVYGSGLLGTVATEVVFDGTDAYEPSFAANDHILVWVPVNVLLVEGEHSLVVRSIDATGVRLHGPVTFTVHAPEVGDGPPQLTLPEVVVAYAENRDGSAVVTFDAVAVDANGPVDVNCIPASGSTFPLGRTSVTCTASNLAGVTEGGFTVIVTDATAPVLTVPEDIISDESVVTFTATATDDLDGVVPVTCSPASGSSFPQGTTLVTCRAFDAHLNVGEAQFVVVVTAGPPQLLLPGHISEEATSAAGAVVHYSASALDGSAVTCTPASGSTFALGTTTVSCSATNSDGTSTATFTVTVVDTTGPVIDAPPVFFEATSAAGANATYTVTATDAVDGSVAVSCTPASGTFFPFGETEVSCTATDSRLNGEVASFILTVQDTTGPEIVSITATPGTLWPPDHKMVNISVSVVAVDAVDPSPVSTVVSVSSNQPDNGTGDGDVAGDAVITGPLTLQLRAERSSGKERVYTITVQTMDINGNITTSTVDVKVLDSKRRASR
ncbi:MAG TPA: HYR domain-containing protein, partial [Thermoanaerobaculia bacterium]